MDEVSVGAFLNECADFLLPQAQRQSIIKTAVKKEIMRFNLITSQRYFTKADTAIQEAKETLCKGKTFGMPNKTSKQLKNCTFLYSIFCAFLY